MDSSFVADSILIEALDRRSVHLPCWNGLLLFTQGETPTGLFIIRKGSATLLMKGENGEEVLDFSVGPGAILGIPAVVAKEPYTLSAMANEHSEVGFVELATFEGLLQEQPCLFPMVLGVLSAEVRSARHALAGVMRMLQK
jgi:CRP-like cAMP-binding protein